MRLGLDRYASYGVGVVVSLGIFSLILVAFGYDPLVSIEALATGSFGSVFLASETFVLVAPLLLSALAFVVAFRGRFYNIGVEGQLYMGALAAYLVGSQLGGISPFAAIPIVAVGSFLGGTAWLALPLYMKIRFQINEIFPTLVMNFLAVDIVNWLTAGPFKDPLSGGNLRTPFLPQSDWLPVMIPDTRFNVGILLAILAALAVYFIVFKTVLGFEVRASGANPRAARSGGVNLTRSTVAVGLMSGGLAGLAGMVVVTGSFHFLAQNFSPGYGYQGIGVAALGSFHPIGALLSSILYSALSIGGESMQRSANSVPIELIYVLQATIVLSVLLVQKWLSDRRRG